MICRILYIIPNLQKGGAERLVLDICNELAKRDGVVVKLITFTEQNEYVFLTQNIDWEVVPASIRLSLTKRNSFLVGQLQRSIDEFKPDVIHTHLFEAEIVSRCCFYPQAKWFSHCHDNMVQFRNFSMKTLFNKKLFTHYYEKRFLFKRYKANGGNRFIAISKNAESYFKRNVGTFVVALLCNAINFSNFYKLKEFPLSQSKLKIINIGSLVDKKNQKFLIEVAQVLSDRNVDFQLNLLGDGRNRADLQQRILENKLASYVCLSGCVDAVEEYLWQSDIYVHSATYEPLGLVLIEAMASGLPVITLDGKGNRDLIEEGRNGYMLNTQNAEEFADKIMELWNNQEQYLKMSENAQEFAKKYNIKEYVDNLLNLYI